MSKTGLIYIDNRVIGDIDVSEEEHSVASARHRDIINPMGRASQGYGGGDYGHGARRGRGPGTGKRDTGKPYEHEREHGPTFRPGLRPRGPAPPAKPEHFTIADIKAATEGGRPVERLAPGERVAAKELYRSAVERFRKSPLKDFMPRDAARFGIKTGAPEEWARLAVALGIQESGLRPNAPRGGLYQFTAADLARYGVAGRVDDPNAQLEAMARQWERYITASGAIAERGGGPGSYSGYRGAAAYFEPFRFPQRQLFPHMAEAEAAATEAGTVPGGMPIGVTRLPADPNYRTTPAISEPPSLITGDVVTAKTMAAGVGRFRTGEPQGLIVHYTGGIENFTGEQYARAASGGDRYMTRYHTQLFMDKHGNITRIVPPGQMTYHAGPANAWAEGMEIATRYGGINPSLRGSGINPEQRAALEKYYLQARAAGKYPRGAYGHSEVTPGHRVNEGAYEARHLRELDVTRTAPATKPPPVHYTVHSVEEIRRDVPDEPPVRRGD